MLGLQELFLNVLFIIVFSLFIPLIIQLQTNHFSKSAKSFILFLSHAIAIISCISFPITIYEGYFFDLRLLALVFGSIYGGFLHSIALALVTMLYRYLFGGVGSLGTIIVVISTLVIILFFIKKFKQYSKKKRILSVTLLTSISSYITIIVSSFVFHIPFDHLFLALFLFIKICSSLLIAYLYEVFQESIYIKQQIIKTEKMEMVSHLASSISHEVRNPLAVVRGFLQMMNEMDLEEAKQKNFLKISIEEIDRADKIIRNYLTFAKPSPENIELMNMKVEILKIVDIITPLANMNSVSIQLHLQSIFIKGEAQLIQQCLLNICKNCIEAMPHSGCLTIKMLVDNNQGLVVITDTGTGMTKEQLARIGEPYFTTKGREGTGLGMMAAIQIIQSLQGKLHVTSKLEEGSTFTLSFPLAKYEKGE